MGLKKKTAISLVSLIAYPFTFHAGALDDVETQLFLKIIELRTI